MRAIAKAQKSTHDRPQNSGPGEKITEGVIWQQLLIFFFPILIGTFFQQLYNTVDAVVVGRFAGKEALSSVGGSSSQILNLVVGFFTGLSAGATVIISQYFGAKKKEELHRALHTAYAFAVCFGILIGLAGVAVTPLLMKQMNTPAELMRDSTLYVRIYFAGLVFVLIYNMGSAILRAIGDSKRPLYYLIICCIINIILDLALVLGLRLGVLGVAVATLFSQGVSAVLVTRALMFKTEGLELKVKEIRFQREMLVKMLRIGLPTGIQSCMYNLSNVLIQAALNNFGVDTMAAWAAFGKIDSIVWMINGAFGIAVTTFVGQNFGARKWDRVRKGTRDCLFMTLGTEAVLSAMIVFVGQYLFGIFTSDAGVVQIGLRMVRVISPTYWLFAFIEIYSGSLRAQGSVLVTTIMTMTGVCILRVVWVMFLVPDGSLEQLIACYPVTWIVTAAAMIAYYFYKQKRMIQANI
ncbi:MAG: MATE family efflux transporter [Eubacteriales bacterium]|nr:MATE family efflux transporter [Eubacteriales bacterium]